MSCRTRVHLREFFVLHLYMIQDLIDSHDEFEKARRCGKLIQKIKEIDGVAGIHMMAYRQEESVAEIIDKSGVLAGRSP